MYLRFAVVRMCLAALRRRVPAAHAQLAVIDVGRGRAADPGGADPAAAAGDRARATAARRSRRFSP